jgi:hypothetical protein
MAAIPIVAIVSCRESVAIYPVVVLLVNVNTAARVVVYALFGKIVVVIVGIVP